jgi:hypothetical protein
VAKKNNYPIFVSLFNGSSAMRDECLAIYPNITVELDTTNAYEIPFDQCSLREGMTSRKVHVLADVIDRYSPDWVLLLDVDMLCRGNMSEFIDGFLASSCDMALVQNPQYAQMKPWHYYSASFVFFKMSAFHAIYYWEFLIKLKETLFDFKPFEFWWDQCCLYAVVEEYKSELNIEYLRRLTFIDELFSNDSYFWTWGTIVPEAKNTILGFFQEFQFGKRLDRDDMKKYMTLFFDLKCYRESFSFAHQLVTFDPSDFDGWFVLGVVYFEKIKKKSTAREIFKALIDSNFRVSDCKNYLDVME